MTGQSDIQRPSPYGESPGLSYVKSRDVPGARKVPDSDQQRQAWLESLEPAQRAEMEERILRSEQEDDAFFARVATHRSLQALGWPDTAARQVEQRLRGAPVVQGLSFRGMRHHLPIPSQERVLRALTATTRLPHLALAQALATRRDLDIVGQRLLAFAGASGRDAREVATQPGDQPVVFLPGTVLCPAGRRLLHGVEVTLYVETTGAQADASTASRGTDDGPHVADLWTAIAAALDGEAPQELSDLLREPNPYFGGELV